MSEYKFSCKRCTNKLVNADGAEYCRPMFEGRKACYIESGETGKDFVFNCDEYSDKREELENDRTRKSNIDITKTY